jgi:hypothetical protein
MRHVRLAAALVVLASFAVAGPRPLGAQAPAPAATDLTGKWSGSFVMTMDSGETNEDVAFMDLKQTGKELAGTAGPNADRQWQIAKGKVEGNKVTFEVMTEGPAIAFELTLIDGHLKGTAKASADGRTMNAVVDVQRLKG